MLPSNRVSPHLLLILPPLGSPIRYTIWFSYIDDSEHCETQSPFQGFTSSPFQKLFRWIGLEALFVKIWNGLTERRLNDRTAEHGGVGPKSGVTFPGIIQRLNPSKAEGPHRMIGAII